MFYILFRILEYHIFILISHFGFSFADCREQNSRPVATSILRYTCVPVHNVEGSWLSIWCITFFREALFILVSLPCNIYLVLTMWFLLDSRWCQQQHVWADRLIEGSNTRVLQLDQLPGLEREWGWTRRWFFCNIDNLLYTDNLMLEVYISVISATLWQTCSCDFFYLTEVLVFVFVCSVGRVYL